jgi:hypothetical protein
MIFKQISLPIPTSEKLEKLSNNFRYGKKLKRTKTIEAMAWQYDIIKNSDRAIVYGEMGSLRLLNMTFINIAQDARY